MPTTNDEDFWVAVEELALLIPSLVVGQLVIVSSPRAVRSDPLRVVLHALEQGEDGECLPGDILVYEAGDTAGGTDVGRELKVDGEEADVGEWVFKVRLFEPEDKGPRSDFGKDGLRALAQLGHSGL